MGNSNKQKTEKEEKKKQREEGGTSLFTAHHKTSCVDLKGGRGGRRAIKQDSYTLKITLRFEV